MLAPPEATPDEIQRAAEAVGIHRLIAALHHGYRTDAGGRGSGLSSGERQLIALARVFLVDPSAIVLDEATSVIDVPSERAVQSAVRAVFTGRTALVIAHRPATLQLADRVLDLSDGHIIEDCAPADLTGAHPTGPGRASRPS